MRAPRLVLGWAGVIVDDLEGVARQVREMTDGRGADYAFESTGVPDRGCLSRREVNTLLNRTVHGLRALGLGPVVLEAYGGTEAGVVCLIDSKEWLDHPGSVGTCIPDFEPVVVGEDDAVLSPGEVGRLYFRDRSGRGIEYRNAPDKTASAHRSPGVFTLGDVGYVDEEGYVYVTDRAVDMIVSGGVNIYPAESEAVMVQHPAVRDVAVIGVPHPDLGEAVRALVEPADPDAPPDPGELIGYCRERLAHYKCPTSVELVDSVGRSAMGKLDKRALRSPYWPTGRTIGG